MLIIDQLKKNDAPLRFVAVMLVAGFCILLAGVWWVQVVSANKYKSHLETQAYRTVRIPALRGKILDREGRVLAENRPCYNLSLYFDDLSDQFKKEYVRLRPVTVTTNAAPAWKFWGDSESVVTNRVRLSKDQVDALTWQARYNVVNRIVRQVGQSMGQPLTVDFKKFKRSYLQERAMPFIILPDLNDTQIARFEEHFNNGIGVNLDLQAARTYPNGSTAAHVLGYLRSDDSSAQGEDAYFNYRLPDYRGVCGIEGRYDAELRGRAGSESVLVNNLGYRQSENVLDPPIPGDNVVLTIDLDIQRAAEQSLLSHYGPEARAAVVVMNVHSGDVLAMASSPTFDPNDFAAGISQEKWDRLQELTAEKNRATFENYAPGSIFKTVVALAALENGLDPNAVYHVQANPANPAHGIIYIGRRAIRDTAPPGDYSFKRAFIHSSNSYFITNGLRAGVENIVRMGEKFHLGERTGLFARQETAGDFPTLAHVSASSWRDGDTANLCIGQGEIAVTPIQMAVMVAAIANGGKVLWPRLLDRIEPQDPASGEVMTNFPSGLARNDLGVQPRNLKLVRDAMLADVESSEGTGKRAAVDGLLICGKTGTAEVQDEHNHTIGQNFWFASFAPYEKPEYAVVVLVQGGLHGSGGLDCAPIAHDIYQEILTKKNSRDAKTLAGN